MPPTILLPADLTLSLQGGSLPDGVPLLATGPSAQPPQHVRGLGLPLFGWLTVGLDILDGSCPLNDK